MLQESEKIMKELELKINEITKEFHQSVVLSEGNKKLTINSIESMIGITLNKVKNAVNNAAGEYMSSTDTEHIDTHCSCGKKTVNVKKKNK